MLPLLVSGLSVFFQWFYRIWAYARMVQLEDWFRSWVPDSVFSAGGGRSSVEAWYTTALDIEEVLSGIVESDVHLFVADVIKSFDTVDRGVIDPVFCSLELPAWFRHAYFEYQSHVRLRCKLAGIPPGCPLSMMFTVALYLPWCRYLAQEGIQPQLCAYNLKCLSRDPGVLLRAAGFYRWVCQVSWSGTCSQQVRAYEYIWGCS